MEEAGNAAVRGGGDACFDVAAVKIPVVPPDETGYLINAAAAAGFRLDGASSYPGGYCLLIAPGFLLSGDPVTIYRLAQAINLALCLLAVICLFKLLFSDAPPVHVWLSVAVAAFYPAPFIYSWLCLKMQSFHCSLSAPYVAC